MHSWKYFNIHAYPYIVLNYYLGQFVITIVRNC